MGKAFYKGVRIRVFGVVRAFRLAVVGALCGIVLAGAFTVFAFRCAFAFAATFGAVEHHVVVDECLLLVDAEFVKLGPVFSPSFLKFGLLCFKFSLLGFAFGLSCLLFGYFGFPVGDQLGLHFVGLLVPVLPSLTHGLAFLHFRIHLFLLGSYGFGGLFSDLLVLAACKDKAARAYDNC